MTGLLLPPDASLTPRPDTQTLRPTLSVNKLAALLPAPDVTQANSRNAGEAGNAVIQARQGQDAGSAVNGNAPAGTTSTRETLSFAARTILDLLGKGAESAPRPTAVLMPAPPTAAAAGMLPAALAGLVDHSGLFYESHLAAWVNGARTLADLRKDPQASLGTQAQDSQEETPGRTVALLPAPQPRPGPGSDPLPATAAAGMPDSPADTLARALAIQAAAPGVKDNAGAEHSRVTAPYTMSSPHDADTPDQAFAAPRGPAHRPQTGNGPTATPQQGALLYEAMARTGDATQPAARVPAHADNVPASAPAGAAPAGPAVHPGAEGLVRQQLELLASQHFRWTGEAWPGTHMAWEIVRDPIEDEVARGAQQTQTWSTRLLLELPELGTVEARLSLSPAGLGARLVANAPDVAGRFDGARSKLQERLAANGIELVQFAADTGKPKGSA